jgi:hypothetical protein
VGVHVILLKNTERHLGYGGIAMPVETEMPTDKIPGEKFATVEAAMTDLGAAILGLKTSNTADQPLDIDELEQRFSELRVGFEELEAAIATSEQHATSDDFSAHAKAAFGAASTKAKTTWNDLRDRASKPENTEAFKKRMKDVGRGFSNSLQEVRKSVGNAYERLNESTRSITKKAPVQVSHNGEERPR